MVIERKLVVWPPDYYKFHSSEHAFADGIVGRLRPYFQDRTYVVEVNASSLRASKQDIAGIVGGITDAILKRRDIILTTGRGIRGRTPIPWLFRPLTEFERDEDVPAHGVGVIMHGDRDVSPPPAFQEDRAKAVEHITVSVRAALAGAVKKFERHPQCVKVVVLEFCGDTSMVLLEEDIRRIVGEADLPGSIDQVWLAYPEWVSYSQTDVTYERIR